MSSRNTKRILIGLAAGFALLSLTGITQCGVNCAEFDEDGNTTSYPCTICRDPDFDECRSEYWDYPGRNSCTTDNQPKQPDGTPCAGGAAMCVNGVCTFDVLCGDGLIVGDEACDDGENNGDGEGFCLDDCSAKQMCADGVQNGTEACEVTDTVDCATLGFVGGTANCASDCTGYDDSTCTMTTDCGNGVVDPGEICDDGTNTGGEGGCIACTSVQECGDGVPEGSEACDDGILNGTGEGQCLDDCSARQECGDGETNGNEVCDDGVQNGSGDGFCLAGCAGTQDCGDGTVNGTELCDDGVQNGSGNGFCLGDCSANQVCGDGVQNGNEFCEAGAFEACTELSGGFIGGDAFCDSECSAWDVTTCTTTEDCGDGDVDPGETCDDGTNDGGDGECLACMGFQTCGDGVLEGDEVCDDGSAVNGSGQDACLGDCSGVQDCGDGTPNGTEVCDDGVNDGGPNDCLPGCLGIQTCGDGATEGTETCDDGASNGAGEGFCLEACDGTQACGDAVVNGTEFCDLGDSESCQTIDAAFLGGTAICNGTCDAWDLSTCTTPEDCGNGVVDEGEACDDGVNMGGEGGCVACQVVQTCGDDVVNGTEECDDGNLVNNDGCNADCQVGLLACDIDNPVCPPDWSCYPTRADVFGDGDFCLPNGNLPEDAPCSFSVANECQPGLGCVLTVFGARCEALCSDTVACANGDVCFDNPPPSQASACVLDACDLLTSGCNTGEGCYPVTVEYDDQSASGSFCTPAGTGVVGDACSGWTDCLPSLACVESIDGSGGSTCLERCDVDSPECPAGSTCVPSTNYPGLGSCRVDTP